MKREVTRGDAGADTGACDVSSHMRDELSGASITPGQSRHFCIQDDVF